MEFIYDDKSKKEEIFQLYQEIFDDPLEFARYYFDEVYPKNQVLIARDDDNFVGMIHLNPYILKVRGMDVAAHYIVAVATKAEVRRQGIMRRMLQRVLNDMGNQGEAFTYLEPANPAYYDPFDFVFAMDWGEEKILAARGEYDGVLSSYQCQKDAKEVISFIENRQKAYDIYTKPTKEYLSRIQKEAKCQGGDLMVWKTNQIQGVFFYGVEEDVVFVRQLFCRDYEKAMEMLCSKFEGHTVEITGEAKENRINTPSIMVRITNLQKLLKFVTAKEEILVEYEIEDSMILNHQGTFEINITKEGGDIKPVPKNGQPKITIKELTKVLFGVCQMDTFRGLIPLQNMYITEEV